MFGRWISGITWNVQALRWTVTIAPWSGGRLRVTQIDRGRRPGGGARCRTLYCVDVRQTQALLLTAALTLVGCAGQARPERAEWQQHWDRVIEQVPDLPDLQVEDPKPVCDAALSLVREERVYLIPTPEVSLDDPVDDWLNVADETFFECPPRSGDIQGFDEAYLLLDDYLAEIQAALEN